MKELLEKVLLEYPKVSQERFKGHQFSSYFRRSIPDSIEASLTLPDVYSIKASAGNGAWAKIPWIAIFNRLVTESVTSGFFCVYLFRADCSGVYLSLNQGIADKRDKHGLGVSRDMIRNQATLFQDFLKDESVEDFSDSLDLKLDSIPKETTSRRLGLAYEAGNIVSKLYRRGSIPNDTTLVNDITNLTDIYFSLFQKVGLGDDESSEDQENRWVEDLTKYRTHRVVERNRGLAKKVKQVQGYTCKACGFNFESRYGEIGKEFIEAHHCIPISSLSKNKIQLDPKRDFTVLCANCHRMIHRISPVPTLEEFKQRLET